MISNCILIFSRNVWRSKCNGKFITFYSIIMKHTQWSSNWIRINKNFTFFRWKTRTTSVKKQIRRKQKSRISGILDTTSSTHTRQPFWIQRICMRRGNSVASLALMWLWNKSSRNNGRGVRDNRLCQGII